MEERIKQLNEIDYLNEFNNFHLKAKISAEINITLFKKLDPKEIIGERKVDMGSNKMPAILRITAKEALEAEIKKQNEDDLILQAIEELRKKYA